MTISSPALDPAEFVHDIYRADQLDLLHLSIINFLDMVRDGEIDIVLDQDSKSPKQKKLFVEKMVSGCTSPELRSILETQLKQDTLDFFREKNFGPYLHTLQREANECVVVKITVALEFKENDIKEMAQVVSERLGKHAVLSIKVDRTLIGGAIIQHGSYLNDYTIKTQLDLYRSRWHKAVADQS